MSRRDIANPYFRWCELGSALRVETVGGVTRLDAITAITAITA